MTEEEAIDMAWKLIERKSLKVVRMHSVKRIPASQLPESKRTGSDVWVVRFAREIPVDAVESPSLLLVNVDDASGRASVFDSL